MFLKEGSVWPPEEYSYLFDKYREYQAWYSGEIEELAKYYSTKVRRSYVDNDIFWARLEYEERTNAVHIPLIGDITSMSSNLLFSESPRFKYNVDTEAGKRIQGFLNENGINSLLPEAAELAAALSGVYLKLDMDTRLSKLPLLSIIQPLNAIPTFIRGRLFEILFYRTVREELHKNIVYRLFENRKLKDNNMIVEYKLYKGTREKVGRIIDINSIEETATLNLIDTAYNNIGGLGVVYVPNMRPNRLLPGSMLGQNDFNGSISLLDSLDFAWTSWIRDIELGMGQIFIDEELLQKDETSIYGTEKTAMNKFSKFQKCFLTLNMSGAKYGGENTKQIDVVQFEMRTEQHSKQCGDFIKQIIGQCGYSYSTFAGDSEGRAESGTALRIRERKSFLTREKKSRYWIQAIKSLLLQMQNFDIAFNPTTYQVEDDITVELEDSIITDQKEQSETLRNLDQARAISTSTKVAMQHPDWTLEEIEAEVKRIVDEQGIEMAGDLFNSPA